MRYYLVLLRYYIVQIVLHVYAWLANETILNVFG